MSAYTFFVNLVLTLGACAAIVACVVAVTYGASRVLLWLDRVTR